MVITSQIKQRNNSNQDPPPPPPGGSIRHTELKARKRRGKKYHIASFRRMIGKDAKVEIVE